MGVDKKMVAFKSLWVHVGTTRLSPTFALTKVPKKKNIKKILKIINYKERPKRPERKMKG
jgi:hypothetical protein